MGLEMKRLIILFLAAFTFFLAGCSSNVEKGRIAYDKGVELMYNSTRFADAEEQFTQAIKYDKNNYEAYYYRGCTKFNRAMYDAAILDFELALEVKPRYADAEYALGKTYFLKNDYEMACFYFKAANRDGRNNLEDYLKSCPD